MNKLITFFRESRDEMVNKVTWPTFSELQNSSVLVLVASLIFAMFIGLVDYGLEESMTILYKSLLPKSVQATQAAPVQ